jgi:hypothetical protein
MAECGVLRGDFVLVGLFVVWQGIRITSVMILARLVIQGSGKLSSDVSVRFPVAFFRWQFPCVGNLLIDTIPV